MEVPYRERGLMPSILKRLPLWLVYVIPPVFAAIFAGGTTVGHTRFIPWTPLMIDLEVYRRAALDVLSGVDFYAKPAGWPSDKLYLPFIYPPFAALVMLPLAWMDKMTSEFFWLILNALVIIGIVRRFGFHGWKLSALSAAMIWIIEPVRMTLGFGQVNVFVMALVALDLIPGEGVLGKKRRIPQGVLTGIATGIKLTPAFFAVYLFLAGKVKAAITVFVSFVATVVIGFMFLPQMSILFWNRLLSGDSGMNSRLKYYTNQSVVGAWMRMIDYPHDRVPKKALLMALMIIMIGVVAAVLWHRLGEPAFAVCLAGLTTLLASPISWSHHFVWVVPMTLVLVTNQKLPAAVRYVGLGTCLWIAYAPFTYTFHDDVDEYTYTLGEDILAAGSVLLGVTLLLTSVAVALWLRRQQGLPWLPLTLRADEPEPAFAKAVGDKEAAEEA